MRRTGKPPLFLLLLDGPMGAGKTTVAKLLHAKLPRTAHVGLDRIKWLISDFKRTPTDNDIVRNVIVAMTREYLRQGISVIVEQGMREEMVKTFERIAKQYKARYLAYQLDAPKPILLQRIKSRPKVPGKPPVSMARIERNYRAHLERKSTRLTVLDAGKLTARQLASRILKDLKK